MQTNLSNVEKAYKQTNSSNQQSNKAKQASTQSSIQIPLLANWHLVADHDPIMLFVVTMRSAVDKTVASSTVDDDNDADDDQYEGSKAPEIGLKSGRGTFMPPKKLQRLSKAPTL